MVTSHESCIFNNLKLLQAIYDINFKTKYYRKLPFMAKINIFSFLLLSPLIFLRYTKKNCSSSCVYPIFIFLFPLPVYFVTVSKMKNPNLSLFLEVNVKSTSASAWVNLILKNQVHTSSHYPQIIFQNTHHIHCQPKNLLGFFTIVMSHWPTYNFIKMCGFIHLGI